MSFIVKSIVYYQLQCQHCKKQCGILQNDIQERQLEHINKMTKESMETIKEYIWKCPGCEKTNIEMFQLPPPKNLINK